LKPLDPSPAVRARERVEVVALVVVREAVARWRRRQRELRVLVGFFELPATPCAWRRCAPSAAGRLNSRPHSGQVSVSVFVPSLVVAATPFSSNPTAVANGYQD
jgi:hypothetical protein